MSIQGTIEEAGLPDVLQLLALGRKTGCLSVVDGPMYGAIYLDAGKISFATTANRLDRLGEMLVKSGRITREHLSEATEKQANGLKQPLGGILVDSGRIARGELERVVRLQVEEAVYFLFTWKQGTFTFLSTQQPGREALLVSLDPEALLLESARRVDEWSVIQKKISSFDLIFRRSGNRLGAAAADDLSEDQNRILPLLDGTRDVAGVVESTGMNEFDTAKALYGLVVSGIAQLVERRASVRHLEYRELLAYVVREAEFADPQRRKEAGRHILDCPTCTARLRTVHVRRTEGSLKRPEFDPEVTAEIDPNIHNAEPAMAAVSMAATTDLAERRNRDRRAGEDRRQDERRGTDDRRNTERRGGPNRRVATNPTWTQSNPERRRGPRRQDDRRASPRRNRASGGFDRRTGTVTPAGRASGPKDRAAALRPQPEASSTAVTVETPAAKPATARAPARSKEIVWVTSPEESLEIIRSSRADLRAVASVSPAATTPAKEVTAQPAPAKSPAPAPSTQKQPQAQRSLVVRRLAIAAAIGSVGVVGYLAGQLGARGPAVSAVLATATAPSQPAAAARPPAGPESAPKTGVEAVPRPAPRAATSRPRTAAAAPPAPAPAPAPQPAVVAVTESPRPQPAVVPATQEPAPTVGVVKGIVRDASGRPVTGARVIVRGTSIAVATDGSGAFEIPNLPDGQVALIASARGLLPTRADVGAKAGSAVSADLTLKAAPSAAEADKELAAGGWAPVEREEAATILGGTLGGIEGLLVESIAKSTAGSRPRVRVALLTESGQRLVLTETRAGAAVRPGPGPARVTALRVMPPSEAYPLSTGTASLGNLLITAKATLAVEALKALLEQLGDLPQ